MNKNKKITHAILSSSLALMLITVFLKGLGYVEKLILGHYYGTGDEYDAYLTALKIALIPFFLFRGILQPVVIPLLTSAKNSSLERSRVFGFSVALSLTLLAGILIAGGEIFAPEIVGRYAEGFSDAKRLLCVRLTRWLLPVALVMSLAGLLDMSLRVQKRFAFAALGGCAQKGVFIACLLLWVVPLGFEWIAGAYWTSALLLLALFFFYHARKFSLLGRIGFSGKVLSQASRLGWPLVLGGVVSQYGRLVQNKLASTTDGAVTAIHYGQSTIDLPLILVPLSLSIVLFPYFCEFTDKEDFKRSTQYLFRAIRFLLLLFVPAAIYALLFREEIALLLWKSGKFDKDSVLMTAQVLLGLAPGLPFFALEMVFMSFFFSRKKTLLPIVCGALATFIAIALLPTSQRLFHLAGVAAYLPIARAIKLALLLACLRFLDVRPPWRSAFRFALKLCIALLPALAAHFLCAILLYPHISLFSDSPLLQFTASTVLLAALYSLALFRLGFPECEYLRELLKKRPMQREK